jgi:hypothetical protein
MRKGSAACLVGAVAIVGLTLGVSARQVAGVAAYTRENFPELRGPYLAQRPPGHAAELFAPGIVSVGGSLDSVPQFAPDGQEVYWSRVAPGGGGIFMSRIEDGRWTVPERMPWSVTGSRDMVPVLFNAGRKLLVHSTRALPDGRKPERGFFSFWVATRQGAGWSSLAPIDFFYTGKDDFSTIGDDGTLYLGSERGIAAIRRAPLVNGRYAPPTPISPEVGGFPCLVGPKDEYLVVARGVENRDLFILFRKADGTYTAPINMGPRVNSSATEQFASLSPGGKYFFFSSERSGDFEVYWVDGSIIGELRKQAGTSELGIQNSEFRIEN